MTKSNLLGTAIGSLPHNNSEKALELIFEKFPQFPIWPQLSNVNPKEDMIAQFTQNLPGVYFNETDCRWFIDQNVENFFEHLEEFYMDYEAIVSEKEFDLLEKYAITGEFTSVIPTYLKMAAEKKPAFMKGQITGPFTYATSLVDNQNRCAFYDDTLKEVLVKGLTLKALWQIKKFKEASPTSKPVIFMDEPTISQYGTSAFLTVKKQDIIDCFAEIAQIIKDNGGIPAVHCCGKTDWSIITESGIEIINFDAFYYAESLSLYYNEIEQFIKKGGIIAWGLIPTLDEDALKSATVESLMVKFEEAVAYLVNKGMDKTVLIEQSAVTPTCGAGSLSMELAEKAMTLTSELSTALRAKYGMVN
ncbi:MAG: hypothetical protein WCK67_06215 [bacterium]